MRDTAAVVVTYNRKELLVQCIDALKNQTYPVDILVVDNAGTDGTSELFSRPQENLFYFNTGSNIGGAGGFNYGMRKACEMGYKFVWVMDDDTIPNDTAHERLIEADSIIKEYGWLSSLALWTDGTDCKMNRQKIRTKDYDHLHLLQHGIISAEHASFVSLFLKTETIFKFGLPISDFFIWGDDMEFTRRICVRNSQPCFLVGESVVVHAMKSNNGSSLAVDDSSRIERYFYAFRNEHYYYRKEGISGLLYYYARCTKKFLKILFLKNDKKGKRIHILLKGVFSGFTFYPEIEYIDSPGKD